MADGFIVLTVGLMNFWLALKQPRNQFVKIAWLALAVALIVFGLADIIP